MGCDGAWELAAEQGQSCFESEFSNKVGGGRRRCRGVGRLEEGKRKEEGRSKGGREEGSRKEEGDEGRLSAAAGMISIFLSSMAVYLSKSVLPKN